MSSRSPRALLSATAFCCLLLGLPEAAYGQLRVKPRPTRPDLNGDPLPDGAVARLGMARLRENRTLWRIAISPDGKLAALGGEWVPTVINLETGHLVQKFDALRDRGWDVRFAADGKSIFLAGQENIVRVVEVQSGAERRTLKGHSGVIRVMSLSEDGKLLVTRSADNTIRVWDTATGKELWRRKTPEYRYWRPIALSPDGKLIACAGDFKDPSQLWDWAADKEVWRGRGYVHTEAMAFSPDGGTLAIGHYLSVQLLDTRAKKFLPMTLQAESDVRGLAFAPDGKTLAAADYAGNVFLWDWPSGKERLRLAGRSGQLYAVDFTPDGKRVVAGGASGRVHVWDSATGRAAGPAGEGHDAAVDWVAFFPDGRAVATAGADGRVRVWDPRTGKNLERLEVPAGAGPFALAVGGRGVTVVPTTSFGGRAAQLLELTDEAGAWRELTAQYPCPPRALSPDGKVLATADKERVVLRDRDTSKVLRAPTGHTKEVIALAFSPDGKLLASGGHDESVRLWDVAAGKQLALHQHRGELINVPGFRPKTRASVSVHALAFGPRSDLLAAASGNDIFLYDVTGGRLQKRGKGHGGSVTSLAFSPDGRLLASNGRMETPWVTIWETAIMEPVGRFGHHPGQITRLAFSPDGRLLATAGTDTTALVWDVAAVGAGEGGGKKVGLRKEDAAPLWDRLAAAAPAEAWPAIWSLVSSPRAALPLLKEKLHPVPRVPPEILARLMTDLDSERFTVRDAAMRELAKAGEAAEPELRKVLAGKPSLELRRRAESLLDKLWPAAEALRPHRALAVLEHIGSPEARYLLQAVADGAPDARLTREARQALRRLDRKTPKD